MSCFMPKAWHSSGIKAVIGIPISPSHIAHDAHTDLSLITTELWDRNTDLFTGGWRNNFTCDKVKWHYFFGVIVFFFVLRAMLRGYEKMLLIATSRHHRDMTTAVKSDVKSKQNKNRNRLKLNITNFKTFLGTDIYFFPGRIENARPSWLHFSIVTHLIISCRLSLCLAPLHVCPSESSHSRFKKLIAVEPGDRKA